MLLPVIDLTCICEFHPQGRKGTFEVRQRKAKEDKARESY